MATPAKPNQISVGAAEIISRAPQQTDAQRDALVRAAVIIGFLLLGYWPILVGIYGSWFDENAYMEHGVLVVPAALYMAWEKKAVLKTIAPRASVWGIWLVLISGLVACGGILTQWYWASRIAFLVALVGCVAASYGWAMVNALGYPLGTLILMITPPTFIFERLTLSLQLLASMLGERALELLGFSVLREGNILEMVGIKLSVEEACSGIRSLLAILFLCVLYNYFFVKGRSLKLFLLLAGIPIAIFGNAIRIIVTGVLGQYHPEWVRGMAHETLGYITVAAAAIGVVLTHLLVLAVQKRRSANG